MTAEEYRKALNEHDWYYRFSDSNNVYKRGQEQENKLKTLAKSNEEFAKMYAEKENQMIRR